MSNFELQIAQLDGTIDAHPTPAALSTLGTLLLARGRVLSRLADYERAAGLVDRAAVRAPTDANVLLARASVRATFHRFDEALADLEAARAHGAEDHVVDGQRAGILQALGRYREARPIRERLAARHATIETLGSLAALDADEGRTADAERRFSEALDVYRDVAPFPVAWLWLQQGTMWQREGRPARARELLLAALERLPELAPAAGHLAALEADAGALDRAEALLRPLVDGSDDPEYAGQLAAVLARAGRADESRALAARARTGFEALLAAHPRAFADHAARFFLGAGADAARALRLADDNLASRRTAEAALLVLDAATAAGQPARACDAAEALVALAPRSVPLHHAAWRALSACGRAARAADVLRESESLSR
jgi:tetratricopeptide (TPR) repeat protein